MSREPDRFNSILGRLFLWTAGLVAYMTFWATWDPTLGGIVLLTALAWGASELAITQWIAYGRKLPSVKKKEDLREILYAMIESTLYEYADDWRKDGHRIHHDEMGLKVWVGNGDYGIDITMNDGTKFDSSDIPSNWKKRIWVAYQNRGSVRTCAGVEGALNKALELYGEKRP